MNSKPFFYVANWKMNMPVNAAVAFVDQLKALNAANPMLANTIIICPSYPLLLPLKIDLQDDSISIGAQNCSEYLPGAYTGQVSANELADIGINFCIIGHSECRALLHESNESIGNKTARLLEQNINPIICIGESAQEYANKTTKHCLETQLKPIINALKNSTHTPSTMIIAYEPVWAIGTGRIPCQAELQELFHWLQSHLKTHCASVKNIYCLYGGSVDATTALLLKSIQGIDGFLIGGASLDFQKFKNIVGLQ